MKTTKEFKESKESKNVRTANLAQKMTLVQFKDSKYGDFDDDEFFDLLEEAGLVDGNWHPTKKATKIDGLFVRKERATQQELRSQFISQGKVIMVRNYEVLDSVLENTLWDFEDSEHCSKALQQKLSEE